MKPGPLECYLRRATRGLWGHRRLEVREELQAHILERARAFSLGGLSQAQAIERVIAELGEPALVSKGMVKLHTLPMLLPLTAFVMLGVSALLLQSPQTLQTIQDGPAATCWMALESCPPSPDWVWVSGSSLRTTLKSQGVVWPQDQALLKFPNAPAFNLEEIYTFAGSLLSHPHFERDGEHYWAIHTLVQALARGSGLPVRLSGWEKPLLELGSVEIALGEQGQLWVPRLYRDLLTYRFAKFNRDVKVAGAYRHRFKVEAPPNTVYALLTPSLNGSLRSAVVAVSAEGYLELNLPWPQVEFARQVKGLPYNLPDQPARVALLRFSGQLEPGAELYSLETLQPSTTSRP